MRKNFTLIFIAAIGLLGNAKAQHNFVGTSEYGRIFNVTYDLTTENKIYAASLHNNILVSNNNGQSWEVLHSFPISEAIGVKDLKQIDHKTLTFIKYNLESINNTVVFYDLETNQVVKEINPPSQNESNNEIKSYSIYGPDKDVMLLHVNYDWGMSELVHYTNDGGMNWTIIYNSNHNSNILVNKVYVSPFNPEKFFLTRATGNGGLLISNDAGERWNQHLEGTHLDIIEFNAFNQNDILVGTAMGFDIATEAVYRSSDSGDSWNKLPLTFNSGVTEQLTQIKFNPHNFDNIIVLDENEIIISKDNGATWTNHVYDMDDSFQYYSGYDLTFNPFVSNELIISGNYYPFHSTNGAETIAQLKNPNFLTTGGMALFANEENQSLYYGVQSGYVKVDLEDQSELHINVLPPGAFFVSPEDEFFADQNKEGRVYTFSGGWLGSKVEMSDDHGITRTQIVNSMMDYLDYATSSPNNPNMVWASGSNNVEEAVIYKVDVSDLNNINPIIIEFPDSGVINGIHINQNNEVIISRGHKIYKSIDEGESWNEFGNGLQMALNASDVILNFVQSPFNPEHYAIATNKGMFLSTDSGENWTQKTYDLVQNVQFSPFNENHLVSITYTTNFTDLSLNFSSDQGETWTQISNEDLYFLASHKAVVHFSEESADIYLGSYDLGIVKVNVEFKTLSVSEPEFLSQKSTLIYPNPTSDFVNIESKNQINSIELYNLSGQKILSSISDKINISHLNKGIYLLKINFQNGKSETQKLIRK